MKTIPVFEANVLKEFRSADTNGRELLIRIFGHEVFSKNPIDYTDSFEDACVWLGKDPYDILIFSESQKLTQREARINAGEKLMTMIEVANEGKELDWSYGNNQKKFIPHFTKYGSGRWTCEGDFATYYQSLPCHPRLFFLDLDVMRAFVSKHIDLYNQYYNQ